MKPTIAQSNKFCTQLVSILLFSTSSFTFAQNSTNLINLDTLIQGQSKHVEFTYTNTSSETVEWIDGIAQGIGVKNLQYPRKIIANNSGKITFDYVSTIQQGKLQEHITLIDKSEKYFPFLLSGFVKSAFEVWPQVIEIKPGQPVTLYVWSEISPQLSIQTSAADSLAFSFKAIPTHIKKDPEKGILENGTLLATKIILTPKSSLWPPFITLHSSDFKEAEAMVRFLGAKKQ